MHLGVLENLCDCFVADVEKNDHFTFAVGTHHRTTAEYLQQVVHQTYSSLQRPAHN